MWRGEEEEEEVEEASVLGLGRGPRSPTRPHCVLSLCSLADQ